MSFCPRSATVAPIPTAVRLRIALGCCVRSWLPCAAFGQNELRCSCVFCDRLGRWGWGLGYPAVCGTGATTEAAGRGPDRLFLGRQCATSEDSGWSSLSDAVCGADPSGSRHHDRRGRDDLVVIAG